MRNFIRVFFAMTVFFTAVGVSHAVTNATSATVTVYKAYFSASPLCTAPFEVADFGSTGRSVDMVAGGSFGSVTTVAAGTYECVIMKMSDQVSFTPEATDGACTAGVSTTIDVCKDYGSGAPTTQDPESGAISTCTGTLSTDSEDTVFLYLSTSATTASGDSTNNPFLPPISTDFASRAFKMNNSVVFSSNATGTFIFNTTGKVDGVTNVVCDMEAPDFGFRL